MSASRAIDAEVRLYDRLFNVPEPDADGGDFKRHVNPNSLKVVTGKLEPLLRDATPDQRFQFERLGYFTLDARDTSSERLVFNRTITLRDTWAPKR